MIRDTPLLVQLFLVFFGLPSLGLRLSAGQAAVIALTVNLGAYATEIVRAGIEAVHKSQIEAGLSLGLSRLQVFRYVALFPALQAMGFARNVADRVVFMHAARARPAARATRAR